MLLHFRLECKHVEDLLQGGLGHGVLGDVELLLDVFHHAEEEADGVLVARGLELPGAAEVLDDLELGKLLLEVVDGEVALAFGEEPSEELGRVDLAALELLVAELVADSLRIDLVGQTIETVVLEVPLAILLIEWQVASLLSLLCHLIHFLLAESLDLDLKLVTCSILVFDVSGGAETLELAGTHDTHLGAKCFRLFHRVSGDDDGTLLALSGYLGQDVPHKSLGLWVNTGRRLIQED